MGFKPMIALPTAGGMEREKREKILPTGEWNGMDRWRSFPRALVPQSTHLSMSIHRVRLKQEFEARNFVWRICDVKFNHFKYVCIFTPQPNSNFFAFFLRPLRRVFAICR